MLLEEGLRRRMIIRRFDGRQRIADAAGLLLRAIGRRAGTVRITMTFCDEELEPPPLD